MPNIGNHVDAIFLPESVNTSTTLRINGGDLHLDDNKKALFGQSDDLEIFHDPVEGSYIKNTNATKNLFIQTALGLQVRTGTTAPKYAINVVANAGVSIAYDNSEKFVTTNTGIDVTGHTETDTLNVSGISTFNDDVNLLDNDNLYLGTNQDLRIYHSGSNAIIRNNTGGLFIDSEVDDGDITIRTDDGSGGTTEYIQCDGSRGTVELYHYGTQKLETTASGVTVTGTALATALSTGASGTGINISTNTISGPATLTLDPAAVGDNTGTVIIAGDLQVDGTTTTINSTTLTVDDKNIVLASGAANSAAADGAGITIDGANQTFIYESANDSFKVSTRLGIRATPNITSNFRIGGNAGGEGNGTTYYNFLNNSVFQPDVTGTAYYNFVQAKTGDNGGTAYTITNLEGYTSTVGSGTISADSTITNLTGFNVKSNWTAGTNNYGFRGQIDTAANTNRWNVYMDGTAPNYFAGNVGIGNNNPQTKLDVAGSLTVSGDVSIADKIVHTGDTNTFIRFPAADTFAVETGGHERLRILPGGNILTGQNSSIRTTYVESSIIQPSFQFEHASESTFAITRFSNSTEPPNILLQKSRGGGIGVPAIVQDNDLLGRIIFSGYDGSFFRNAAQIAGEVDGSPSGSGGGDMPGALIFKTSAGGSAIPSERLRINSSGNVGIGTNDPQDKLHILDSTHEIKFGNVADGPSNGTTDAGVLFKTSTSQLGGMFTELDGKILSYGTNISQLENTGYDSARSGGIFRFDTRTAAEYTGSSILSNHCFVIKGREEGQTSEYSAFGIDLNTGDTLLCPEQGDVGIGTADPQNKLHVKGGIRLDGSSAALNNNYSLIYQNSSSTVDYGLQLRHYQGDTGDVDASITIGGNGSTREDNIVFYRSNGSGAITETMRIDESGNVGIGTNAPTESLDVRGVALASLLVDSVYASETWPAGRTTLSGHDFGTWTLTGGTLIDEPSDTADDYHEVDTANLPQGLTAIVWNGNATASYLTSPNINITNLRTNTGIFGGIGGYSSATDRTVADSRIYLTVFLAAQSMDSSGEYLEVELSSDGGTTWAPDIAFVSQDSDQDSDDITDTYWRKIVIDISEYSSSTFQIRFKGSGVGNADGYGVSNIYIHEAPIPNRLQAKTLKLGDGKISGTYEHSNALTLVSGSSTSKLIVLEDDASLRQNYIGIRTADNLEFAADEDDLGDNSGMLFRIDGKERMKLYTSTNSGASEAHLQLIGHATPTDRSNWRITAQDDGTHGYFTISDFSGGVWNTNLTVHESGNVGIGTTDPAEKLDVHGSVVVTNSLYVGGTTNYFSSQPTGTYGSIQINGSGKGNWEGYSIDGRAVFMHDGSTTLGLYDDVNDHWAIRHLMGATSTTQIRSGNNANTIVCTGTNQVGMGIDTPARGPLHIHQGTTGDTQIHLTNSETGSGSTDGFTIFAGGSTGAHSGFVNREANARIRFLMHPDGGSSVTDQMVLLASGNLGLGISEPTQKLHVNGNAYIGAGTNISPTSAGVGQITINANGYTPYIACDATAMYIGHNSSSRELRFQTNESTKMYIAANAANVGIGTTTTAGYALSIRNSSAASTTGGLLIDCHDWSTNSSEYGINCDIDSTTRTNLTGNKTHRGISMDMNIRVAQNASNTSGTRQSAYGVYGRVIFSDTDDNDGKAYYCWGGVFTARVDGINASNVRGSYNLAQCGDNATGQARTVDNIYGAFNLAINDGNQTTITNAYATYSHVNQDDTGGSMTNAYGVYSRVDRDSGSGGTGYALRGIFEGTWSNKRGLWITGDTENSVAGSFSANSKNFRIRHPLPELSETKDLVHVSVEAPAHDLIYRGKSELINGSATINLDTKFGMTEGTFVALNRNIQCFTSNESDWSAVRGSVSGNILTIECQDSSSTAMVSWMVIGERQDDGVKSLITTDADGNLILEPDQEPEDVDEGKPEMPD